MPARTPLFRLVAKSLAAARAQARTGQHWEEALARRLPVAGWNRREFLGGAAVATAGLALTGTWSCRTSRPASAGDRVVVVGAGIAGLAAAYRLRQAGVAVRLLEAQDRVGGRMWSLRGRFADGQVAELGGELIDTGHERLRRLCAELAIDLDDVGDDDPALESEVWYFGGARRTTAEVVAALEPFARRIDADLARLGDVDVDFEKAPPEAVRLDRTTLAEWLETTPGEGWVRDLLRVAYTTEYGLEPGDQSSLNLLLMIGTDPFAIFGESDERFHVRGGNDRVIAELAAQLPGTIETGVVLEAVRAAADGSFRLAVRHGSAAAEVVADHLVLALPFTQLRGVQLDVPLAAPAQRRAIAELGYGTNAKLMVGFTERVWRLRHGSTGALFTDLAPQSTWEASRRQPGRAGILTNFTGGAHGLELGRGTAAEQAAAATGELERVFPGLAAVRAGATEARFHWPSFCWAGGSYASYRPGQWTTLRGAEGLSHGRLHFAGEHCSRDAQGFMEGGCETGERAAAAILAGMGLARAA